MSFPVPREAAATPLGMPSSMTSADDYLSGPSARLLPVELGWRRLQRLYAHRKAIRPYCTRCDLHFFKTGFGHDGSYNAGSIASTGAARSCSRTSRVGFWNSGCGSYRSGVYSSCSSGRRSRRTGSGSNWRRGNCGARTSRSDRRTRSNGRTSWVIRSRTSRRGTCYRRSTSSTRRASHTTRTRYSGRACSGTCGNQTGSSGHCTATTRQGSGAR